MLRLNLYRILITLVKNDTLIKFKIKLNNENVRSISLPVFDFFADTNDIYTGDRLIRITFCT